MTQEPKWTPGPWFPAYWSGEINGGESGNKPVIDMNTETFDPVGACVSMDEEERANFDLIAAAPEMYDGGEHLLNWLSASLNCPSHAWDDDQRAYAESAIEQWRHASAKARGQA